MDALGRLLAYVDVGATDAGEAMIRAGYSRVYVFKGQPFQRIAAYRQAEQAAKSQDAGVWGDCAGNFLSTDEPVDAETERKEAAKAFVRRYYSRVTRRQFGLAWSMLSASQKRRFGRYSGWRAGYRRSLGTRVTRRRWSCWVLAPSFASRSGRAIATPVRSARCGSFSGCVGC